jgi:hypothetical protein
MADPLMPDEVRAWMQQRNWGTHHLEWHVSRQWDRLPPAVQQWAARQGWRRAAREEGEPGNGFEFLVMHRAMIELLREQFPQHANLFGGWATPPTNPADPNDPLPDGLTTPFDPDMSKAVRRIEKRPKTFADDDDFGLYVQTHSRPKPGDPFAQSDDPTTGLHNYLHSRFQDAESPVNMGNPERNLGNQRFWRLHGWLDARWSAVRRALGLADDGTFRGTIEAEKHHLRGHDGHAPGLAAVPLAARATGPIPASATNVFQDTLAKRFHRLMATTPQPTTVEELQAYLALAIQLEHFTIPLYLTALWSLRPAAATNDQRGILLGVALDEMLHMGLAANLLVAVGGTPTIDHPDWVPHYPDVLPGIDEPTVFGLEAFSREQVECFLRVELPEHGPIPPTTLAAIPVRPAVKFPTIGDFYKAIDRALDSLSLTFSPTGQRATQFPSGQDLFVIRTTDDAHRAVRLITQQGEGTDVSQGAVDFGGGLAHYYQFEQILRGMKYVKQPDGRYKLDPAQPLAFPAATAVYPMARVPEGGYPGVEAVQAFDRQYSEMVHQLNRAWAQNDPTALDDAIGNMFLLRSPAQRLMQTQRDPAFGPGNYGPAFRFLPAAPAGPAILAAVRVGGARAAAAPVPGYARIKQILDDAVGGKNIGKHGPFWRTLTRDEFVAKSIFGRRLLATRPDGSFDPDASNLVKALEGRAPFGANLPAPPPGAVFDQMPVGFPPVPPERIAEIRAWIGAGCPERVIPVTAWINAADGGPADPEVHVAFWRDLDNRAMFQADSATQAAIDAFFGAAGQWLAFAKDAAQEPAWVTALADAAVRDGIGRLEGLQRDVVVLHFGRPVPMLTLLDGFARFGADQLPDDLQRPVDPRHRMDGKVMWFFWSAFCDACLRIAGTEASIPAEFWQGLGRGILLGLLNDGAIRGRFRVTGFAGDKAGQQQMFDFARQLGADQLQGELAKRYRESGL